MRETVQCDGTSDERGRTHVVEASTKAARERCIVCGSPVVSIEAVRRAEAAKNKAIVNALGLARPANDDDADIPI